MNVTTKSAAKPVFIIGVAPRSGTNFLEDILSCHPLISRLESPREDFLFEEAQKLDKYIKTTIQCWNSSWRCAEPELRRAIGEGISFFLQEKARKDSHLVVTKTPSTTGISRLPQFLPDAKVIIIARDPILLVDSGRKSFRWTWFRGLRRLYYSELNIQRFLENVRPENCYICNFETLVNQTKEESRKVFQFLGLSSNDSIFFDIQELNFKGSSERPTSKQPMDWQPRKIVGYNPTEKKVKTGWFTKALLWFYCQKYCKRFGYYSSKPRLFLLSFPVIISMLLSFYFKKSFHNGISYYLLRFVRRRIGLGGNRGSKKIKY